MATQTVSAADLGTVAHKVLELSLPKRKPASALVGKVIDTFIPRGHSPFSPSAADRWFECTASVNEIAKMPLVQDPGVKVRVTEELAQGVQRAMDCVKVNKGDILFNELEIHIPATEQSGHLDIAVWRPKAQHLDIYDYKNGSKRVHAQDNRQMMLYLLGMIALLAEKYGVRPGTYTIAIHILQPNAGKDHCDDGWGVSWADVRAFDKAVRAKVKEAKTNPQFRPSANTCFWCPVKDCKARAKQAYEKARSDFAAVLEAKPKPTIKSANRLSNDELAALLAHQDFIERMFQAAREEATKRLQDGKRLPGWCLAPGQSRRVLDEAKLISLCRKKRIDPETLYDKSMVGLGELEKRLGKDTVDKCCTKSTPALTLQRDDRTSPQDDLL